MMPLNGNSFLQSYMDLNKTLAVTLLIKSETSADTLNDYIALKLGESSVDRSNPRTWKYYLNISGEYHPFDTQMVVTSLDTLEEITFNKTNLEIHRATKEAYAFGTRYYYSLLSKYPNNEQLIKGVLLPVDIDEAIAAEDGTILNYPSGLVEPQEETLIYELELFIKNHIARWHLRAFGVTDSLYNVSYYANLYLSILPKLLNLRLSRCKTNEAHSFHIREYLASHNGLDRYLPYMTLSQSLYLYRNIIYLERNAGKVETLKELIQHVLTERQLPIAEYSVRHLNTFDDKYYPEITFRRKPLNNQYNSAEKTYIDSDEMYSKENRLVYGNARYHLYNSEKDNRIFKNSRSSVIQTKNLESNMVDYTDAVPDTLEEVLARQWIDMASHGMYTAMVMFKDTKTNDTRSLSAIDALIYYTYLLCKSSGVDIVNVPDFYNTKSRKHIKPTLNELLSKVDKSFREMPAIARDILDNQPEIVNCTSTSMFYDLAYKIYEQAKHHWHLISNTHGLTERANVETMVLALYKDENVVIASPNTNINLWLSNRNLPTYSYTYSQAQELMGNVVAAATGASSDGTKLLKNIQKYMLELLKDLSSYTIQVIREINDSKILPLNWAAIRVGDLKYKSNSYFYLKINNHILERNTKAKIYHYLDATIADLTSTASQCKLDVELHSALSSYMDYKETKNIDIGLPISFMTCSYPGYNSSVSSNAPGIGMEYYLSLTEEQRSRIKSIYD